MKVIVQDEVEKQGGFQLDFQVPEGNGSWEALRGAVAAITPGLTPFQAPLNPGPAEIVLPISRGPY